MCGLTRFSHHISDKWKCLGIYDLIKYSLLSMDFNTRVCAALFTCWSPTLNCFLLPEGPLTITLEDFYFMMGCSPFGE